MSRVVVAVYGDAPYEGEAACILELPPGQEPKGRDKALFDACARGDVTAAKEAIAAGASPGALDRDGNTPLHHAVAARSLAVVQALVEAGADPDAQSDYTNPPLFADRRGRARSARVGPFAARIAGEDHARVLAWLVEHGADATSRGVDGTTLVDLAIASPPLDERLVRWLIERGASSRLMRMAWRSPLEDLISDLDTRSKKEGALVPVQVRVLCWLGCDPNARDEGGETAVKKFLTTGYSRREVEPEVLVGIARALMESGARDEPDEDGDRPSDLARQWGEHSPRGMGHYAEVARVFAGG